MKIILISLFIICLSYICNAQISQNDIDKLRENYAVPDGPAFILLGNQPSSIIRPTKIKDFAVIFGDFNTLTTAIAIPKSIAIEIAPVLLINKPGIKEPGFWESLRISIGTNATQLSVGIRFSFYNGTNSAKAKLDKNTINAAINASVAARITNPALSSATPGLITLNEIEQQLVDSLEAEQNDKWNEGALEIGAAFRGSSADSLAKNLRYDRAALWIVGAKKLDKWGQFVVGLKGESFSNLPSGKDSINAVLQSRLYAGVNYYKGFVEMQAKYIKSSDENDFSISVALGAEARIADHIWAEYSAGFDKTADDPWKIISKLQLKYGI